MDDYGANDYGTKEELRETGVIQSWSEKGFGFILRDSDGSSLFCHASEVPNRTPLIPNSKVSFEHQPGHKGGKATRVQVEEAAEAVTQERERGIIKTWNAVKHFGFIGRDNGGDDAFVHSNDCGGMKMAEGQAVSFVFEAGPKGAGAKQVQVEEGGAPVSDKERETGIIQRWNGEKGFGFVARENGDGDAFVHKRDSGGEDLAQGQRVSFVIEDGEKGASAKSVQKEEGGELVAGEDEGQRELGKVKGYNEEKGFAFIGRCVGGDDLFAHKRDFGSVEPSAGLPVSFIAETTDKGDAAKKIREEETVPDLPLSDKGRDFGIIKSWIEEKGFGFIAKRGTGEEVRFFDKQLNEVKPIKNLCVSFVLEENDKGLSGKDLREEDLQRVARVTAKVHHGIVDNYFDPTKKRPTNGYGFILPTKAAHYGAPKKYYFHMDEIETPDEYGGIDAGVHVSFIIIPAKKGVQAASVTICDPPKPGDENIPPITSSFAGIEVNNNTGAASTGWGDTDGGDAAGGWGDPDGSNTGTGWGDAENGTADAGWG